MEIKINIYKNCTDEKPSKTYTIRRILFKTAKEITTIQEEKSEGKEVEQTLKMLQCVIPEFKEEDLEGIDPTELGNFFKEIGKEIKQTIENAQKN